MAVHRRKRILVCPRTVSSWFGTRLFLSKKRGLFPPLLESRTGRRLEGISGSGNEIGGDGCLLSWGANGMVVGKGGDRWDNKCVYRVLVDLESG